MGLLDSMRDYHLWVVGPQSTEHHALPAEHLIVEELLTLQDPFLHMRGRDIQLLVILCQPSQLLSICYLRILKDSSLPLSADCTCYWMSEQ